MVSGNSLVRQKFVSLCRFPSLDCLFRIVVTFIHYRPSGPKWGWLPTTKSSFRPLIGGRQPWRQVSSSVSKRFRSEFACHNCDYMFFCFRLYFILFSHAPYRASHHVVSATGFYSFVFENRNIRPGLRPMLDVYFSGPSVSVPLSAHIRTNSRHPQFNLPNPLCILI